MQNSVSFLIEQLSVRASTPNAEAINRQLAQWLTSATAEHNNALAALAQQPHWQAQFKQVICCSQFALTQITSGQYAGLLSLLNPALNNQWQVCDYQQMLAHFVTLPCDEKTSPPRHRSFPHGVHPASAP